MKKNNIFYACAAAALVFASCQKEVPAPEVNETPSTVLDVITATTLSTKTATEDGVNVLWENGDQIGLWVDGDRFVSAVYTANLDANSATAEFVRTEDPAPGVYDGTYFALYPASSLNKWASAMDKPATRRVYFNLPTAQTAVSGGWDKTCGILASTSTTSDFQFNHIVSYVKFTVAESSDAFVSLTVKANNGESLAGENIGVLFGDTVAYDPAYTSGTYSSSVTISNEEASAFTPGTYYVAVLPGTFAKGFTFTFTNAEGLIAEKVIEGEVVMNAGSVANMGTVGTLNYVTPPAKLELATVYAENGVNQGVVFWVDSNNPTKGKIISGAPTYVKWGPAKDLTDAMDEYLTSHTPAENHEYVKAASDYSDANYPAVYFCDNLGDGWRLPHRDELKAMLQVYWGVSTLEANGVYNNDENSESMNKFDSALAQCVTDDPATSYDETKVNYGTPTATINYWAGHANPSSLPSTRIFRVNIAPKFVFESYANPTNVQYVRCVREVESK